MTSGEHQSGRHLSETDTASPSFSPSRSLLPRSCFSPSSPSSSLTSPSLSHPFPLRPLAFISLLVCTDDSTEPTTAPRMYRAFISVTSERERTGERESACRQPRHSRLFRLFLDFPRSHPSRVLFHPRSSEVPLRDSYRVKDRHCAPTTTTLIDVPSDSFCNFVFRRYMREPFKRSLCWTPTRDPDTRLGIYLSVF